MANTPEQHSPSGLAKAVDIELRRTSTFSKDTVRAYTERVKANKPRDAKFIQLVRRAVAHLSTQAGDPASHYEQLAPPDLASILEIWQENERAHISSSEHQPVRLSCLDKQGILQAMNEQATRTEPLTAQRYMALPTPYLPCVAALLDLEDVKLSQLEVESHNRGKSVAIKTIGQLVQRQTRTLCGVIDSASNTIFLELTCMDPELESAILHDGAAFAIKEPHVTTCRDVAWCIRIDHPSDLTKIPVPRVVEKTANEWKEHGNISFKQRRLGDAAAAYENGLQDPIANENVIHDLHRNLAQTYLALGFWERAKRHADLALDLRSATTDGSAELPRRYSAAGSAGCERASDTTGNIKALYRAACAAYTLEDFVSAKESLQALLKLAPQHPDGRKELLRVYKRLNEEQHGAYNFDEMLVQATPRHPQVDAASFTLRTTVSQSQGKGNGLFATKEVSIGDLVLCEKAFVSAFGGPTEEPMRTYDTSREIFSAIPAALWKLTAQKVFKNSSLAPRVLGLGGSYEGLGSQDLQVDGTLIIDVFQVHDIAARNSFGIPTPSPTARSQQWGLYSSQSRSDGSTNLAPRNSAIFCHAAFLNHSCLPNVEKRFAGDMMIVRATRPIAKGEEILLDYAPGEFHDVRSRKIDFQKTWQFQCVCPLCAAESQQSDQVLDRRISLTQEVNDLSEELSRGMPASVSAHGDAAISRLETLSKQLRATYSESELPKSLAYTHTTLALLYGARKQYLQHVASIRDAFESLGWHSPLDTSGILQPRVGYEGATVLDLNVPQLLYMACAVASSSGDAGTVAGIKQAEPQVYLALNGTMHGFKSIEERMRR